MVHSKHGKSDVPEQVPEGVPESVHGGAEAYRQELIRRYLRTCDDVANAAEMHGRKPDDVRIIAVSKFQPAAAIAILADQGHRDFGENYVQEALHKQTELPRPELLWHFMGRLQRNKAKYIPGKFAMFHALDDQMLASGLQKRSEKNAVVLDVLLQVNFGQEEQKGGVSPEELPVLAEKVCLMRGLALRGLMSLPPFAMQLADKQRIFAELRGLRDNLERRLGRRFPELSMGTTDDFPQAIAEGATIVRIGTRIFGRRPA